MNHLFNNISWSAYFESLSVVAIAYYAFIGWKYYRADIQQLINKLSGKDPDSQELPPALQYQAEEPAPRAEQNPGQAQEITTNISPQFTGEAFELTKRLGTCIDQAQGKPFAPAVLIPKIKQILNDFPAIAATIQREDINAFIVCECENTGTALLSEIEVDMWWSA